MTDTTSFCCEVAAQGGVCTCEPNALKSLEMAIDMAATPTRISMHMTRAKELLAYVRTLTTKLEQTERNLSDVSTPWWIVCECGKKHHIDPTEKPFE